MPKIPLPLPVFYLPTTSYLKFLNPFFRSIFKTFKTWVSGTTHQIYHYKRNSQSDQNKKPEALSRWSSFFFLLHSKCEFQKGFSIKGFAAATRNQRTNNSETLICKNCIAFWVGSIWPQGLIFHMQQWLQYGYKSLRTLAIYMVGTSILLPGSALEG